MALSIFALDSLISTFIGGATRIPPSYGDRAGQQPGAAVAYAVDADAYKMSMDSAFWVANLVANLAYDHKVLATRIYDNITSVRKACLALRYRMINVSELLRSQGIYDRQMYRLRIHNSESWAQNAEFRIVNSVFTILTEK